MSPACLGAPLARSIVCPACGREGLGGRTVPCRASSFSSTLGDCGGPGSVAPAQGLWEQFVGSLFLFDIMGRQG